MNISEEDIEKIKNNLSNIKQILNKKKEEPQQNQLDLFGFSSEQIVFIYFMLNAFGEDLFSFNLQKVNKETIETIKQNYPHLLKEDTEEYEKFADWFKETF